MKHVDAVNADAEDSLKYRIIYTASYNILGANVPEGATKLSIKRSIKVTGKASS